MISCLLTPGWGGPAARHHLDEARPRGGRGEAAGQRGDSEGPGGEHTQPPPLSPGSLRLPGHQQGGHHLRQRQPEGPGET